LDHQKHCRPTPSTSQGQLQLKQCLNLNRQIELSQQDANNLKRKQAEYCKEGYYRAIEHTGFVNILQTCVNLGAKYGIFDVAQVLLKRKATANEVIATSTVVKSNVIAALKEPIADGSVSLCLDMYTDDYRKRSYLAVHACWITRQFLLQHAALSIHHFGTESHNAVNISLAVSKILAEYGLSDDDTPVTTDHGSNIIAALKNNVRLDCYCHRLHTVLETAWRETQNESDEAAAYEAAEVCRYAKQSSGVQEQLPKSLKHGGDTRPWISMYRRADSIECSYDKLITVLTLKNKLDLIARVNRELNKQILAITQVIKYVTESLERVNLPTLQLVAPSCYVISSKLQSTANDENAIKLFRSK
jgi:hypothetical protein